MRLILILTLLLMLAARSHAGWFDGREKEQQQRIEQQERQLEAQRKSTGTWQLIAGVFAIGAVILFTAGTALGSRIRRHGNTRTTPAQPNP